MTAKKIKPKSSNTAPKEQPKKKVPGVPFKPGKGKDLDPRINAKGRPKSFDALRKLATDLLTKDATYKDAEGVEHVVDKTYVELILLDWMNSSRHEKQKSVLEYAYGEVPKNVQLQLDVSSLTDIQLQRIAKGEDILSVLASPNG